MAQAMIEVRQVYKSYGHRTVLDGVDLTVSAGEVVCIIGPSGGGKSTLLRCINHLETVDAGTVTVDGRLMGYHQAGRKLREATERQIAHQRAGIGMVFQRFNLFPHLTVLDNVCLGPVTVRKEKPEVVRQRAIELLDQVGLSTHVNHYPAQLSGGQQQRVAIARALAMEPQLVLFDEPTSALDPELVGDVLDAMRGLADRGLTMVVVTHEIAFARDVASKVVFLADGKVQEEGPAGEVLTRPASSRLREFLARV